MSNIEIDIDDIDNDEGNAGEEAVVEDDGSDPEADAPKPEAYNLCSGTNSWYSPCVGRLSNSLLAYTLRLRVTFRFLTMLRSIVKIKFCVVNARSLALRGAILTQSRNQAISMYTPRLNATKWVPL